MAYKRKEFPTIEECKSRKVKEPSRSVLETLQPTHGTQKRSSDNPRIQDLEDKSGNAFCTGNYTAVHMNSIMHCAMN